MDPANSARRIAETVLFPAAAEIDSAESLPPRYLDVLAGAGLYDLDGDPVETGRAVEALGGASLTTAFVWIQHHSVVRAVAAAGGELRDRWLGPLRRGEARAGIAYAALRRPGPPSATGTATAQGWALDGFAPWVTGWGLIDVVLVGARSGPDVVWLLVDATAAGGMTVEPVALAALQASATVQLRWEGFEVPAERVVGREPFDEWRRRDAQGRQLNGYLAIGVAARCCRLLGPSPLDEAVAATRRALDQATPATVVAARSAASLLAVRAATALAVHGGGGSVEATNPAARLMREATFLLVFGQTADIKAEQLARLGAARHPPVV